MSSLQWVGDPPKEGEVPPPNELIRAAIRRLFRGYSVVMSVYDYAVVENTLAKDDENPIVACMCLQATPGYYGKVQLQYGTPECVGSHPDYRNRGLIRRLFLEMIHPASKARGDVIQIIPGIPYFYRQFGYEYAISIAKHQVFEHLASAIPALPQGKTEPYLLREPVLDDIPYLVQMSTPEQLQNHAGLGAFYTKEYWRYTVHDLPQTAQSNYDLNRETRIIVDAKTGQDCGLVMTHVASLLCLNIFTLQDPHRHQYRDALYPVLRQMIAIYQQPTLFDLKKKEENQQEVKDAKDPQNADNPAAAAETKDTEDVNYDHTTTTTTTTTAVDADTVLGPGRQNKLHSCRIMLSPVHPVTQLLQPKLIPFKKRYRLYTRIPSYADFILTIAPTLHDRLAKSCLAGISVTWHFDFFRQVEGAAGRGLEIIFDKGQILSASDDWVPLTPYATMLAARERIARQKEAEQAVAAAATATTAAETPSEERPSSPSLNQCHQEEPPLEFKAEFAPLTLTRLLVGDLSITEMLDLYGECSVSGGTDAEIMLDILFPKQEHHFDLFWW
ncbi:hypothetical protein BGZ70_002665 [Mortierella alpina]|uniref:Uncharacterized protein n=1 Tax=Mortierella alpina TaxID=64518 RepID=A0A9P6LVW0_MORAP|nr:hypothetical protein BGZ70_002665 [Mortierella alpina]